MKAAISREYGNGEILSIEDIPIPKIKSDEILIKVNFAAVNRSDCANLTGKPFIMRLGLGLKRPKKLITGTEFSGVIEKIGDQVTRFKKGDKVFAFNDSPLACYAEYTKMKASLEHVDVIPEIYNLREAGYSLEGFHYAYNFLNKLDLKSGQEVLINGAGGGIGSAMTQLAIYFGLKVSVTCRSDQIKIFESMNVDKIINYEQDDFTKLDQQFDFVLDSVGKSTFNSCRNILKKGGVYMSSELGPGNENIYYSLITAAVGSVPGSENRKVKFPYPPNVGQSIKFLKELAVNGEFKPIIDRSFPFYKISEAFNYVLEGKKTGNVIVEID